MPALSIRVATSLAALLALAACNADRSRFPSLAVRPAERAYGTGQPASATPVLPLTASVPGSADLAARVAALRGAAITAHARFQQQRGAATRLIEAAKGTAPGSDAWSSAAIALAGLTSARGQGMVALADLDRLLIAATEQAAIGPDADLRTVTPAHREVGDLMAQEDRAIAALSSALGG